MNELKMIVVIVLMIVLSISGICVYAGVGKKKEKQKDKVVRKSTDKELLSYEEYLKVKEELKKRYISKSDAACLKGYVEQIAPYLEELVKVEGITTREKEEILEIREDFEGYIDQCNKAFVKKELAKHKRFFEDIDGKKLDLQQRKAIIVDDDYNLILAGAGSGKTLTISGKVKYLTEKKGIKPEEILLLSFTKKAAQEMTERIEKILNIPIESTTFHKLGLKIITQVEQKHPNVVDEVNKVMESFFVENQKFIDLYKKTTNKELFELKKLLSTYLKLFKTNNYTMRDMKRIRLEYSKSASEVQKKGGEVFFDIFEALYNSYERHLHSNRQIDFEDMINQATNYVREGVWQPSYRYIIIDEYQDISAARCTLIKEIIQANTAKLLCVGDDWQSIYGFAGSDISMVYDFQTFWGDYQLLKIEHTYRNSQELIDIASEFILKNKEQFYKKLKSHKHREQPIKIIKYHNDKVLALEVAIQNIVKEYGMATRILLLGRTNNDLFEVTKDDRFIAVYKDGIQCVTYSKNKNLDIKFLTVHRSKGLECDNVILLNLKKGQNGFPNEMIDDPILDSVMHVQEKMKHAQERRLFYVAITRTKNDCYLLVPAKSASTFAIELREYNNIPTFLASNK